MEDKKNTKRNLDLMIDNLSMMYENCHKCYIELKDQEFTHQSNQEQFDRNIIELEHYIQQIYVHVNLKQSTLLDVDFYTGIKSYFRNKKQKKQVVFSVQNGHDTEKIILKNEIDAKKVFTLKNCLSIMRLIPMQLASNARKYKIKDSFFEVNMLYTEKRNYLTFSNIGPFCNTDNIKEQGVRGDFSGGVDGMGIGLAEVEFILQLHEEWLDTSFDIIQSYTEITNVCDVPYSNFTVEISYLNINDTIVNNFDMADFENGLDVILIHNSLDISSNLIEFISKMLKINEKNNNLWKSGLYRLRFLANLFLYDVKLNLYIYNNMRVENILGNSCRVELIDVFSAVIKNASNFLNKNIDYDIQGKLCSIETKHIFLPSITTIVYLIFKMIPANSMVEITYFEREIIFECRDVNFEDAFVNLDEIDKQRFKMYNEIMIELNNNTEVNNNRITLNV